MLASGNRSAVRDRRGAANLEARRLQPCGKLRIVRLAPHGAGVSGAPGRGLRKLDVERKLIESHEPCKLGRRAQGNEHVPLVAEVTAVAAGKCRAPVLGWSARLGFPVKRGSRLVDIGDVSDHARGPGRGRCELRLAPGAASPSP